MWTIGAKIAAFFAGGVLRWLLIGGGAIAIVLGAYGGGYLHGQINSKNAAQVRRLEATVDQLKRALARRDAATAADNAAREADRAELERLAEANRNLQNELEEPDRECLGRRDTDRLRSLWH